MKTLAISLALLSAAAALAPLASAQTPPAAPGVVPTGQTGPAILPPRPVKPAVEASTQAAPTGPGKLTIQLTQGTKDGPPIGAQTVTVTLLHRDAAVRVDQVAIDDKGHGQLDHLPVMPEVRPMIVVKHNGVEENGIGGALNANNKNLTMKMDIYETTEKAPAWSISSRHILVKAVPEGLSVNEMFEIHNPDDHIWIGQLEGGPERVTLAFPLPAAAIKVGTSQGWHPAFTRLVDGKLMNLMPMFPGDKRYGLAYTLPVKDGQATFTFTAPAPEEQLMVIVPLDATAKAEGLVDLGAVDTGPKEKVHALQAKGPVKTGETATITLTGIVLPPAATQPGTQPATEPATQAVAPAATK